MNEVLALLFLGFAVFVWPYLLFRRMRAVRDTVNQRHSAENRDRLYSPPYVDETHHADGSVTARSFDFNEELSNADKRASELPDINQTLQGKR